jgi:hypothetical protein
MDISVDTKQVDGYLGGYQKRSMDILVDTKKGRWISRWIPKNVDGYLGGYQQIRWISRWISFSGIHYFVESHDIYFVGWISDRMPDGYLGYLDGYLDGYLGYLNGYLDVYLVCLDGYLVYLIMYLN